MSIMATAKNQPAPAPVDTGKVTDGLTSQLFGKVIEPDKPAPTVEYDDLKLGAIVSHRGIKVIEYTDKTTREPRKTKLHMFATRGGEGPWFSVFGSANLDSQLRKTRPASILLLRYAGKQPIEGTDKESHTWEVAETAATIEQIRQLRDRPEWRDRELALDAAIAGAGQRERERRDVPRDEAPPHDDTDRPY